MQSVHALQPHANESPLAINASQNSTTFRRFIVYISWTKLKNEMPYSDRRYVISIIF
jgi:hypothetical protein